MEKKITLGGKEFRIGFDFSTLLEIENEFGTDFQKVLEKVAHGDKRSTIDILRFAYACVKSFNSEVEPFVEWLHCIKCIDDMSRLNAAITEAQNAFFYTPSGSIDKDENLKKDEDPEKNA